MPRGADNRVETRPTNGATEASNRFLGHRIIWNTAEIAHDTLRYATLPLRLAGNIIKDTFKEVDDTPSMEQIGWILYESMFATSGAAALAVGIGILASNPVGWAVAAGIGVTALGAVLELPNALLVGTGLVKGVVDTVQYTREKNQRLSKVRAGRRARWN